MQASPRAESAARTRVLVLLVVCTLGLVVGFPGRAGAAPTHRPAGKAVCAFASAGDTTAESFGYQALGIPLRAIVPQYNDRPTMPDLSFVEILLDGRAMGGGEGLRKEQRLCCAG